MGVFELYVAILEKLVNYDKSTIVLSKRTLTTINNEILGIMKVRKSPTIKCNLAYQHSLATIVSRFLFIYNKIS